MASNIEKGRLALRNKMLSNAKAVLIRFEALSVLTICKTIGRFRKLLQMQCCGTVRLLTALHVGHAATAKGYVWMARPAERSAQLQFSPPILSNDAPAKHNNRNPVNRHLSSRLSSS